MELRRKAYDKLLDWKRRSNGSTALLVEGARRVGKSHLVKTFAENEYRSHLLIDFSRPIKGTIELFEDNSDDLDLFFNRLAAMYRVKLHPRESLIIFDEVQRYPHAREMIKHLVEDGRYDYIETGSLISIKANTADIVIPSEEDGFILDPLDFEEFLWALGDETLYGLIKQCFEKRMPVGTGVHRMAMDMLRQYMLVGGMPQAVLEYVETKDFGKTDEAKRRILRLYREDIVKFATGYHTKVLNVFDLIPAQLSKKEKRFNLADIKEQARFREYESSFMWLADGMIINQCFNSTDPSVALRLNIDSLKQKCYMADTGLLVTHSFSVNNTTDDDLYRAILTDRIHVNEGMIAENLVAQALHATGHGLFFYSRYKREDVKENRPSEAGSENVDGNTEDIELDFLIIRERKVCPVEVKSSGHLSHSSLDKFKKRFGSRIGEQFMLYPGDVTQKDGITCLPLYMAWLL